MEDGAVAFDLAQSKYSISGERNKCVLHLWSTPTAKRAARLAYSRTFQRMLEKKFRGYTVAKLTTAMDLERSFGPVYTRGLLRQGQSAIAVLGVNGEETQASVDAALTFGILWLDSCRQEQAGKVVVEGLSLLVPPGTSALVRERMAHLHREAAKWRLYEFDEPEDRLKEIDVSDRGNIATRLVHWTDERAVRERFAESVAYVCSLMGEVEIAIISAAEISFRCRGLEFARARLAQEHGSFRSMTQIVFGVGAEERVLSEENNALFVTLLRSVGEVRHAEGPRDHPLWRLHPERWLESLVVENVGAVDERLDASRLYSQVPAVSASDRAMIDVLTVTREGRLAVVELKADSFNDSDIFRERKFRARSHYCFWCRRRCMFIQQPISYFITFRRRFSGR